VRYNFQNQKNLLIQQILVVDLCPMPCFQVYFSFLKRKSKETFFLAKEALIPGSIYDRTATMNDKRQMSGTMYGNNFASNLRTHDPLSYIDTGAMSGMSQPPNGLNLPMPHQMMMSSMPMPYMGGPPQFNHMMNGKEKKML
jgi:hypothetical protein